MHGEFFTFPVAEIFQTFLYRLYYTLCKHRAIESYFIHGCGVLKEHNSIPFYRTASVGKNNGRKSAGATVIHDDQILISRDGNRFTMDSPPLPARDKFCADTPKLHILLKQFL